MSKKLENVRKGLAAVKAGGTQLTEFINKLSSWEREQVYNELSLASHKRELTQEEKILLEALIERLLNKPARGKTLAIRILGPNGTEEKALAGTAKEIAGQLELASSWKLASYLLKMATQDKVIVLGCQDSVIDRVLYGAKGDKKEKDVKIKI